ncbi:MAG TPA: VOC family protein [Streptosporangiaceae bacterium]|nr:VOC family protein [Streptosporangiaceae bacterium]
MALARFKDVCHDAVDPARMGQFWATALGLSWEPFAGGDEVIKISGPTPEHTIWVARVPETKTVKNRVHFETYGHTLAELEDLGARVIREVHRPADGRTWTVMADPEGGEFCVHLRDNPPDYRLACLIVDSADPVAQGRWWSEVYGAPVDHQPGISTIEQIPGMPIMTLDFSAVPEPKTVKNRIHWDVAVPDLQPLIDFGATVLRPADEEIRWHVLADPEGNEFCAFVESEGR